MRTRVRGIGLGIEVRRVEGPRDLALFVELAYRLNRAEPNWIAPLRSEVRELLNPRRNPWFGHARLALFLAFEDGVPAGRISAQVESLPMQGVAAGTGHWGMFEASGPAVAAALLAAAEGWLAEQGMRASLGPLSLSIWDEPGLLVEGHARPPSIMMGHHRAVYAGWIEAAGHKPVKDLHTYDLPAGRALPPLVQRILAAGRANPRIRVRQLDAARYGEEAEAILALLNDAWSGNWGFVPFTEAEKAYAAKKLKPLIFADLVRIADYDGEPAAFMIAIPDINGLLRDLDGRLFPFGWAKLLWRMRRRRFPRMRVPLMGVALRHQASRLAVEMAFMMIEEIRCDAIARYGAEEAEIGWILEDNKGMLSIARISESDLGRVYRIYGKAIG